MDFYTDPKFNSLVHLPQVLANLTFLDIAINIPDNCTGHCAPAADFLDYLEGSFDLKDEGDVPISKFSTLVRSCTAPGLLDHVSNGQIIDWYFYRTLNAENDIGWMYLGIAFRCFNEFCNGLTWEGNPDISGIGVNIAFFIQAALTAVFLLIYVSFYIAETHHIRKNPAQANRKVTSLWRKAADDCLEVFWSTCYVFALTLAVGTLCFNVIYHSPGHVYSGYFGYLGTVLSVAVLVCLWTWFPGRYRYPVLTFRAMTFLKEVKSDDKTIFERACLETRFDLKNVPDWEHLDQALVPAQSTTYVQNFVMYTPYGTLALFVLWGGAFSFILVRRNKITYWKLYKIITGILGGLLVICSFALVWIALGFFFHLRTKVESLAGPSYAENEWGFGQIVAIVAWGPLVAQIGMVLFRSVLKDTKYQKWFNPAPESERYTHHLLAQSPTVGPHHGHGSDVEKEPVTSVTQQDITDAGQR
ncbi:hypothetical protein B0H65DRAFT_507598 [Neurospora tetraspora]|uniref:Uncharacterized protein n=1 Tax=Neurospora tetraspora TaxID=94610 RepID=A0AAE0MTU9_9PEZI|nr:hypothetical protein B0H65DRAFT_507598 [Neurospora tetraspora]